MADKTAIETRTEIETCSVSIHGQFPNLQTAQKLHADQELHADQVAYMKKASEVLKEHLQRAAAPTAVFLPSEPRIARAQARSGCL